MPSRWALGWLLFRGNGGVDVEVVANEGWVNSWSIAGVPCKHIDIPLEKLDQLFLFLRRQLGPYLKEFLRVAPDDHLLQIFAFCLIGDYLKRWRQGF